MGGDFEACVRANGKCVGFRRRGVKRFLKNEYDPGWEKNSGREVVVGRAQFEVELVNNMIIALRRMMSPTDIVADSADFLKVIKAVVNELTEMMESSSDAEHLREKAADIRMKLFMRLMQTDLRRVGGP
jgi:hypothetical protein